MIYRSPGMHDVRRGAVFFIEKALIRYLPVGMSFLEFAR